jgi:hypothetical protein
VLPNTDSGDKNPAPFGTVSVSDESVVLASRIPLQTPVGSLLRSRRLLLLGVGSLLSAGLARAASALLSVRAERVIGEIHLFDFGADAIRGWKMSGGTLVLHLAGGAMPERVAISSIAGKWQNGNGKVAVERITFGGAGSVHGEYTVKGEQGWMEVRLEGRLLESLASGNGYGLAIRERGFRVDGRRPVERQPRLLAEGTP